MPEMPRHADLSIAAAQRQDERAYWLAKLAGSPACAGFYPDLPAPGPAEPPRRASLLAELPPEAAARLIKLAGGSADKLFMALAALVAALVYRYSGQPDFVLGAPIHRQSSQGRFINTVLPLRASMAPGASLKDLILQMRGSFLEAVEHQNYPLEKLTHDLGLAGQPLLEVGLCLEGLQEPSYLEPASPRVVFVFSQQGGGLACRLDYDAARYLPASLEQVAGHLARLAGLALAQLDEPLDALEMIAPQEKAEQLCPPAQVLDYPRELTVTRLFEEQARRAPQAVALQLQEHRVTFLELNQRANRLARLLRARGVGPESLVAVAAPASLEVVTAILAVLKAGGAYLPLDPAAPQARLREVLADSGTRHLLALGDFSAAPPGLEVLDLAADPAQGLEDGDLPQAPQPGDLAYVIYTSGSSGKPKGVLVEHRGLLNFARWRTGFYSYGPSDVTLQLMPESFDGFGASLYPSLLGGGRLVFLGQRHWNDLDYIRGAIRQEGVTCLSLVPSMYQLILDGCPPGGLDGLRFVALAGERASTALLRRSQELAPHLPLFNEYGPTETSVAATAHQGLGPGNQGVIGQALANNQVLILDRALNLLPLGQPGQLCVSGLSLARGYRNLPQETQERFVANPHALACGPHAPEQFARLYLTGDLARRLPSGDIELLGRLDQQVKVRGFRVEPTEIEPLLAALPGVAQAAVAAGQEPGGESGLWAYLVLEAPLEVETIRARLLERLPEYMVPTRYLRLAALPLSRNGKLDRAALARQEAEPLGAQAYAAPRNPLEETLAAIWREKLGLERVGVRDNYFNIGGDSLKAIGLLNAINASLGCDLRIPDLYEHKTVEALAARLAMTASGQAQAQAQTSQAQDHIAALKQRIMGA